MVMDDNTFNLNTHITRVGQTILLVNLSNNFITANEKICPDVL